MLELQEQIELGTGLKDIAVDVVNRAIKAGATSADAIARDGNEFSTSVRMGEV
jgi:PmbA protein